MLYTIELEYGDVEGMTVLDLGCGTGMLSIASSLLGARWLIANMLSHACIVGELI